MVLKTMCPGVMGDVRLDRVGWAAVTTERWNTLPPGGGREGGAELAKELSRSSQGRGRTVCVGLKRHREQMSQIAKEVVVEIESEFSNMQITEDPNKGNFKEKGAILTVVSRRVCER